MQYTELLSSPVLSCHPLPSPHLISSPLVNVYLTFPDHGDTNRHAHKLAFGPDVGVDTHPLLLALTVET